MHLIARSLPIALLALGAAACEGEVITTLRGDLQTLEVVDFGDVQVGILMPFELEVKNAGTGLLRVTSIRVPETFSGTQYEFKLSETTFTLQPSQSKIVTVSFQPFGEMETPVESSFRMETDILDEGSNPKTFTVRVLGRGITSGLEVVPNPVDFGQVLVGSSRTLDVQVFNRLSVPVDLLTVLNSEGRPQIINQGGLGRFELIEPTADPLRGGSLLPSGTLLEPNASITVKLRYVPDPSQEGREDRGRWTIANCDNPLCELDVVLLGRGTNAAIECDPASINFGQVNPGATLTMRTTCSNVASEPVTVLGWNLGLGSSPDYTLTPYNGQVTNLGPGAAFDVEAQFSPTMASVGTMPSGSIVIRGRNPAAGRDLTDARVSLAGEAGGPDIAVTPTSLSFGRVAIGTSSRRHILVENTGFNDLTVTSVNPDTAGTAMFTADRQTFIVAPGASEVIEIVFAPTAEREVMSEVLISSNDSDEGELRVTLRGEGVNLPPCSYTLTPVDINFGIVQVLRTTTQGARIENIGANDCLINDVTLTPDSSSAFALLAGNETNITLPAGQTKTILISFTPGRENTEVGTLTFYISDPSNSEPEVGLRGVGSASALLISPNELDFGRVGVNCATRDRPISIFNTGSQPTTIDRIVRPAGVSMEFVLDNLPMGIPAPPGAGVTIPPGQSIDFSVRYRAIDIGVDLGFFHVFERGRTDPYVVPLFGEGSLDPVNEDRFTQLETPEVDIMFVIDNSCSMSEEQASLTANFQSFIQFADSQALDYQIGVVSTDVDGCPNPTPAQRPAALAQAQCGFFADGNGTGSQRDPGWRLITPDEQPSPTVAFSAVGTQGTNGSGSERGLEAAYRALSSPIITGWNSGFLRPSAYLALIFISDEEDQSNNSVDFYINYFLAIKGFRNTQLFSASAIVGDAPSGCGGFQADAGTRYIETADRTGGIFESICTADWAQALQNLGLSVFGYKSKFFLLNQPVPGTVSVSVDGVPVMATAATGQVRWSYDPASNSVNFAPLAIPEPGSEIVITYRAECL